MLFRSLVMLVAVNRDELAKTSFDNTTNRLTDEISLHITDSMHALYHMSSFYHGSEHVTSEEFNQYVGGFISLYPEIHAVKWAPRILHSQRRDHEQQQSAYKQGYTITEKGKANAVIPASERDYYFPVTYLYPMKGSESAFGYDLASNMARKGMLEGAVYTNSISVSSRIRLTPEKDDSFAVLIALPIIAGGKIPLSLDSPNLQGFVLGVFRIKLIIDRNIEYIDFKKADIIISEHLDGGDGELLFHYHGLNQPIHPYVNSRVIKVANREWRVQIKGDPEQFGATALMDYLIMFMIGFGFTVILAAYIHLLCSSQQQARQISERLTHEMNERKKYEKRLIKSNSKLEILLREDPVMKIANRRAFNECLLNEWRRAQRSGFPLSLRIADIDNFKAFNDKYGHVVGDLCLREVAAVFSAIANRPSDMAARYGGEEIVVILSETFGDGAVTVAERIREAVAALCIPHEDSTTSSVVTISLGVTTIIEASDYSMNEIIKSADAALYLAKQQGKNRVVQAKLDKKKIAGSQQQNKTVINISTCL